MFRIAIFYFRAFGVDSRPSGSMIFLSDSTQMLGWDTTAYFNIFYNESFTWNLIYNAA